MLNAGVVMGTVPEVMRFCLLMWSMYLKTQGRCSDQAALNYLVNGPLAHDNVHYPVRLEYPLVLTGEGVAKHGVKVGFDGMVFNPETLEKYCVFHQWERTEYRQAILDRFAN